ncbi:MAG: nucleotide exchange factor GrpE [Aquihabitans sp.]
MTDPHEVDEAAAQSSAAADLGNADAADIGVTTDGAVVEEEDLDEMADALQVMQAEIADMNDRLMRNQAEFENVRRRLERQATEAGVRSSGDLAEKLLPVLDACDSGLQHGASEVEPIFAALLGTLEKEGLVRVAEAGTPFDPNVHEAVFHEEAADGEDGTVVSEVLRSGYLWNGRVLRPAMVKVRG